MHRDLGLWVQTAFRAHLMVKVCRSPVRLHLDWQKGSIRIVSCLRTERACLCADMHRCVGTQVHSLMGMGRLLEISKFTTVEATTVLGY